MAKKKPKKQTDMATEWIMDVSLHPAIQDFPQEGTTDLFYIDESSLETADVADVYVWNGSTYDFIGHRPPRPNT